MLRKFVNVDSTTFLRLHLSCCLFFNIAKSINIRCWTRKVLSPQGRLSLVWCLTNTAKPWQIVKFLFEKSRKKRRWILSALAFMMHRISSLTFPRTFWNRLSSGKLNFFRRNILKHSGLLINFNESMKEFNELFRVFKILWLIKTRIFGVEREIFMVGEDGGL